MCYLSHGHTVGLFLTQLDLDGGLPRRPVDILDISANFREGSKPVRYIYGEPIPYIMISPPRQPQKDFWGFGPFATSDFWEC